MRFISRAVKLSCSWAALISASILASLPFKVSASDFLLSATAEASWTFLLRAAICSSMGLALATSGESITNDEAIKAKIVRQAPILILILFAFITLLKT